MNERHDPRTTGSGDVGYGTTDSLRHASTGRLVHFGELDEHEMDDGQPDIRGWDVKAGDGRDVGEVADLLVDTATMRVRYIEVKLDEDVAKDAARAAGRTDPRVEASRHVLVPIGLARLDDDDDAVRLDTRAEQMVGIPSYRRDALSTDDERGVLRSYGRDDWSGDRYDDHDAFDDRRFLGRRSGQAANPGAAAGLVRLDDIDDYKVADGNPDPRGWTVTARDGRTIGKVRNLLVDRQAMRARYLEVELDENVRSGARTGTGAGDRDDRLVHVPVAQARLNDDDDRVTVDLDATAIAGLGRADLASTTHGGDDDDRRFFGARGRTAANAPYLVLHEERLAVGTRPVRAGEVRVRKRVETERVRERVPVSHDEVSVERRPVTAERARTMTGQVEIGEDEIRVPVMREEIVTEKRVVPTEEVVVRKRTATEQQSVDETVRRERIDVDRDHVRGDDRPGATDR